MLLDTPATIQERTHTHYIYTYKGREAAEVGGHAVQEITARPPELAGGQKGSCSTCFSVCLFRLSCLCAYHGSGDDGTEKTPKPCQPPRLYLMAAHYPDRSRSRTTTAPEPPRLCLVAAHDPDPPDRSRCSQETPPNRTGHTPTTPSRPGCAWWQLMTPTPTDHSRPPRTVEETPRPPRAVPAVSDGSSGARPPPNHPQITPHKIVTNAYPRVPGDTLSPGEGILPQFTHPRGADGEFSAAGGQLRERKNSGFDPKSDASIIQLNNIAIWVKIYILDK